MTQNMHSYLFCLLLIPNMYCTSEIITLQRNDRISCITEDMETPIFISPPITEGFKSELNTLENVTWLNDDWSIKNASNTLLGPVTDKRWEDFEIQYTNYMRFTGLISSLSFSIYSPSEIYFYMDNGNYMSRFKIKNFQEETYNDNKWTHFTVHSSNRKVHIFKNGELVKTEDSFIPSQFVMKTDSKTYWKVHDYNFKWANTAQEETPTTLIIPPTGRSCVMIYVSMCETCLLKVDDSSNARLFTKEIRTNNKSDSWMVSWQIHTIDVEPDIESTIKLHRMKISGIVDKFDYWGLDVRYCPPIYKDNKVVYNANFTTLSNQEHKCTFLNEQDEHKKNTPDVEQNKPFQCRLGMFGNKCDISCKDIPGSGSNYCEKSRICENSDCRCVSGYRGDMCQDSCAPGNWGFSCEKTCNTECGKNCDILTGECPRNRIIYLRYRSNT